MMLKKGTRKLLVNEKLRQLNKVLLAIILGISMMCVVAMADSEKDTKTIYQGCEYDASKNCYYYSVEGVSSKAISSSILNGTYTNSTVWVNAAGGITYQVYKNGKEITVVDGNFVDPGEYSIVVYDNVGKKEVPLKFTILGRVGNYIRFDFPGACRVESVLLNGEETYFENSYISLEEEGKYEVNYRVLNSGKELSFTVTIDKTAPLIKLVGLNEKNEASHPVEITEIEAGATVNVTLNGKAIDFKKKLVDSGKYKLLVRDEAGNETNYEFTILPYYNISSFVVFVLVVLVVVGICAYVVYLRKNLRVR